MVLIDAYPAGEYFFQNVGVDDYSGGYQIGSYLCSCGFDKACFLQKQILTVITAVGWALSRLWKKKENSVAALV